MYKCECGKEFETAAALGGHKSHCLVYAELRGKPVEQVKLEAKQRGISTSKTLNTKAKLKATPQDIWSSEPHYCEHCGKLMTEKFGSGRFCCRACANSHVVSEQTKNKIAAAIKNNPAGFIVDSIKNAAKLKKEYELHPKHCVYCGKTLPYEKRYSKTCSKKCYFKLISNNMKKLAKKCGGNINKAGVRGTAKYGTYKGFHCDSSYELAFVVYCLEHNIQIERNKKSFPYQFNGETRNYYPDFIINGDTYIEVKNYLNEMTQAKIDAMPKDIKYQILYKTDMKKYLDYCIAKYGKDFYQKLYNN